MKDRTGDKFNKLTVLKFSHRIKSKYYWFVRCDCGKEKIIDYYHIIRKKDPIKSCGCASGKIYFGIESIQFSCFRDCGYADGDLTFEEFMILCQQSCFYCGKLAKDSNCRKTQARKKSRKNIEILKFYYNGLDRVDNTKPHNKNNVVPCCFRCNSWKQNLTYDNFKSIIEKIHLRIKDVQL